MRSRDTTHTDTPAKIPVLHLSVAVAPSCILQPTPISQVPMLHLPVAVALHAYLADGNFPACVEVSPVWYGCVARIMARSYRNMTLEERRSYVRPGGSWHALTATWHWWKEDPICSSRGTGKGFWQRVLQGEEIV